MKLNGTFSSSLTKRVARLFNSVIMKLLAILNNPVIFHHNLLLLHHHLKSQTEYLNRLARLSPCNVIFSIRTVLNLVTINFLVEVNSSKLVFNILEKTCHLDVWQICLVLLYKHRCCHLKHDHDTSKHYVGVDWFVFHTVAVNNATHYLIDGMMRHGELTCRLSWLYYF